MTLDNEAILSLKSKLESALERHFCNSLIVLFPLEDYLCHNRTLDNIDIEKYFKMLEFIEILPECLYVYNIDRDMNLTIRKNSQDKKEIYAEYYDGVYRISYREIKTFCFETSQSAIDNINNYLSFQYC